MDITRELSKGRSGLGGLSFRQVTLFIVLIFALGIYVGNLLFGKNSLEVYMDLQNKSEYLKQEVSRLQNENAKLQKDYFELKMLEPK